MSSNCPHPSNRIVFDSHEGTEICTACAFVVSDGVIACTESVYSYAPLKEDIDYGTLRQLEEWLSRLHITRAHAGEILHIYNLKKKSGPRGRREELLLVVSFLEILQKTGHRIDILNVVRVTGVNYKSLWNVLKNPVYSAVRMYLRITAVDLLRLNALSLKLTERQVREMTLIARRYASYHSQHAPKTVAAFCYRKYFESRDGDGEDAAMPIRVLCNHLNVSPPSLLRLQRKIENKVV